ncbi:Conserved_hypothetical protein [Hexamita inflata]|uniref:Uncharacterized protein n=1 Tax=Hexamita inflata TaxID=28002 RepID=A0AA86PAD2_9EUKA|nr:Conserved hypothetical protein [Hexamita inflata]
MNHSLQYNNYIIEQQKQLVDNITQQLNCTSNYGYSIINGSCFQVTCAITGQQSINGICQCTNINSVVQSGSCVCPPNSNVIGTACVCSISGQIMQNGQCLCSTSGAFVDNNVCTCGVNSLNISNQCSCPSGANLINGICSCSNINSYILGNQCVCPTYSSLEGNICTCPSNSLIVNNECVCNLITGQVINNGACQCQTTGAFVNNGECVCGQYALNISNICQCPVNSTLVNNICTCDQIIGQQIISGSCQCPSGQQVVYNSCQQIKYIINNVNIQCESIDTFISNFNINSITNQICSSNDFSSGYVFNTATIIQNAYIDISDNVYTSTVNPIFQSQNTFTNIKIQFGTQNLNGGSLIISSSTSVSINQMNIISKSGSQLTVNTAQLNILTSSSTSANITNLLVNLSFALSSGNITLINNINGVLNISGYQILGSFVSTSTVAMVGINVNSATISVNQISFQPIMYNVGNGSSYLFGSAITTVSTFKITNLAVIIGLSSNFLLLGSTASSLSNYYLFGGIIAYINNASILSATNIILDSYQNFSTSYVCKSGFLVGYVFSNFSSIMISNVCLQQNVISTTIQFNRLGLIGWNYGNTSIINVSVILSVQGTYIWGFGLVGVLEKSIYAELLNVKTFVSLNSNDGAYVGSIVGIQAARNCSIINTTVAESYINNMFAYYVGGFCGSLYNSANTSILNSSITNSNITGMEQVGGIVGLCSSKIYLIQTNIQFVRITGSKLGVVVGQNYGTQQFFNSLSSSNYLNGNLQMSCGNLSNVWSAAGC